jgi:hypothetical protein
MTLKQFAYASTAIKELTDLDLIYILKDANDFNSATRLTGFLLYSNGHFMQVLEGTDEDLEAVMRRIESSSKHTDINKLYKMNIAEREFPHWAMGFKNSNDPNIVAKFEELLHINDEVSASSMAKSLLHFVATNT